MKNQIVEPQFTFSKSQNSSNGAISQMDTLPGNSLIKKHRGAHRTFLGETPVLVFSLKRFTMGASAIPFSIQLKKG